MCVIFACESKVPSIEKLTAAGQINDDGGGLAWVEAGKVRWKKGLTTKELLGLLNGKPLPLLIHFRIATEGGISAELTHPFPLLPDVPLTLEGLAPAVLMHNGTYHSWRTELKEACQRSRTRIPLGPWSDTRAIAWLVANYGLGFTNFITNQKLAILQAAQPQMIFGPDADWIKGDGWFASNKTWENRVASAASGDWKSGPHGVRIYKPGSTSEDKATSAEPSLSTYEGLLKELGKGKVRLVA